MSLRIAFDCDGVIANLDSALAEIAVRLFGEAPKEKPEPAQQEGAGGPSDAAGADASAPAPDDQPTAEEVLVEPARFRALTRHQQHEIWETVRSTRNFWESLPETEPGAVARLATLAVERQWEVILHHAAAVERRGHDSDSDAAVAGGPRVRPSQCLRHQGLARQGRRRPLARHRRRRPAGELPRRQARVQGSCDPGVGWRLRGHPAQRAAARHRAGGRHWSLSRSAVCGGAGPGRPAGADQALHRIPESQAPCRSTSSNADAAT